MKTNHCLLGFVLLVAGALPVSSQVSNNNEDGVNKIEARSGIYDFVPGQVLVKFKDESSIQVRRNAKGQFRAASISAVDNLLRQYGVIDMEKLFPTEVAKPKEMLRRRAAPNGTVVQEKNLDKVFWIKTNVEGADSTMQLIEQLKEMPEVEYAEPNYRVYITADIPQNDSPYIQPRQSNARRTPAALETTASFLCPNPNQNPLYTNQYNIKLHNIDKLWDKPIINKKRPVIAILDTGVDINHPDLQDNIWVNTVELEGEKAYDDDGNGIVDDTYGWNFVENYYDLTDYNGHGTHVAGIAAASDNGVGIVGANPHALIMPIKVLNDRGVGDIGSYCRGLVYAAENGADIINMSFGHGLFITQTEVDAIQKAYITTVMVASAGNNGVSIYNFGNGTMWPAAYYLVLGVQVADKNGNRASWSNYDPDGPIYSEDGIDGRNYEMLLAGDDIYSTLPNGQYNKLSGTSMSAPLLAGAISALQMLKEYPSKDVLFGDLIHLNADFEKIYSDETPRWPKIDVVSMEVDDNLENNSNVDGQIDVGETIKFYPVLLNTWADATNIKLKLTVDNYYKDFVEILNPQVDFGYSISAYGRQKAQTPIMVMFGNNIGNNTRIRFTMTISYHENEEPIQQDIYITVYNIVKLGGLIASDMTLTADKNYLVSSNLAIPEGVTFTVEPGTTIKFAKNIGISNNGNLVMKGKPGKMIVLTSSDPYEKWGKMNFKVSDDGKQVLDTLEYCIIENSWFSQYYAVKNSVFINSFGTPPFSSVPNAGYMYRCNIEDCDKITFHRHFNGSKEKINWLNLINNDIGINGAVPGIEDFEKANYFNTYGKPLFYNGSTTPQITKPATTVYMGTSSEDIANKYIYDIDYDNGYEQVDLTNMRKTPYSEAHGIVWKVVVNGYDAQDEYEDMPPLGVAKHKFEVYFNRPMNKLKNPEISFGVREPYTQQVVNEDGEGSGWNEEGTIYTAYKTINGRTQSDGVNRIYVRGAEDDEFFEIPYEKTRFNINIQAAGSLATGFMGEAGLGKVTLTWNNENNDFEDAMGFNVYRYTVDAEGKADTTCINKEIVDIEATEYIDYDVTPGTTYYYYYKVLSTDLKEYDISNVVSVTPQTASLGDANGSGDVDVADVITTVNYAAGMEPKPFIFDAADVNVDAMIDILDVIGIIQKILNPTATAPVMVENVATYTVEDGMLYVESPVDLAGVQVQLSLSEELRVKNEEFAAAADLDGFERVSAWLSDNDYLFLAYNMNGKTLTAGKHALLHIGDAQIASIRLSNVMGGNVPAVEGETTNIEQVLKGAANTAGIYNLHGQRLAVSADQLSALPKGVYIVDGKKVIKWK